MQQVTHNFRRGVTQFHANASNLLAPPQWLAGGGIRPHHSVDIERIDHHVEVIEIGNGGEDAAANPE